MPSFIFQKRLGQGRDRALQYLRENPLVCDEIEKVWCYLIFFLLNMVELYVVESEEAFDHHL